MTYILAHMVIHDIAYYLFTFNFLHSARHFPRIYDYDVDT
jgi:hypothetical protein